MVLQEVPQFGSTVVMDSITPRGPSTACFIQTEWRFQSQPEPQSFPITPVLPSLQPPATPASLQGHRPHPRPTLATATRLGLWGSLLGHQEPQELPRYPGLFTGTESTKNRPAVLCGPPGNLNRVEMW